MAISITVVLLVLLFLNIQCLPIQRALKLGTATGRSTRCVFDAPSGSTFSLLVGVPYGESYLPNGGNITIAICGQRDFLLSSTVKSDDVVGANWLSEHNLMGILISEWNNEHGEVLASLFDAGTNYVLDIVLDPAPPEGSSYWLFYLAPRRAKKGSVLLTELER